MPTNAFEERRAQLEREMHEPITLDGLTGSWRIFQRRHGHRHSTDDLLTAWYAVHHVPSAQRLLDLGAGIGTVGLLVLSQHPGATLTSVEVQAISFRLLGENLAANDLGARVQALHGDLRDVVTGPRFAGAHDLVTGSPPYFDVGAGIVPADSQKAAARFELHGDVRDYCRAAAHALTEDGRFVVCFPPPQRARALDAVAASGLHVLRYRDVIPRAGRDPLFTLVLCARTGPGAVVEEAFVVRDGAGEHTAEMTQVRRLFGMTR